MSSQHNQVQTPHWQTGHNYSQASETLAAQLLRLLVGIVSTKCVLCGLCIRALAVGKLSVGLNRRIGTSSICQAVLTVVEGYGHHRLLFSRIIVINIDKRFIYHSHVRSHWTANNCCVANLLPHVERRRKFATNKHTDTTEDGGSDQLMPARAAFVTAASVGG